MIALLLALALQLGSPTSSGAVEAAFELVPPAVQLGQPTELVLTVRHPSAVRVQLGEFELDDSWVVFEQSGRATRPDPERGGRALTTQSFRIASLEPGERELATISIAWNQGDVRRQFDVQPATLGVAPILGPDEDSPRPLVGFRDVEDRPRAPLRPHAWIALATLALAAVGFGTYAFAKRRKPSSGVGEDGPSATELLAELDLGGEPAPLYYAMTRAVRLAGAGRGGSQPAGATDAEWVAALAEDSPDLARSAAEFFERCESVKYAAGRPTEFAVKEALEQARALVTQLQEPAGVAR